MNNTSRIIPLTEAQIRQAAPQAYAPAPKPGLSSRYTFLPTSRIIADMDRLGWKVGQAFGSNRSRSAINREFGNHVIKFFHPDIFLRDQNSQVESYIHIVMMNNHNGLGRYKFDIGIYRLVCSNGLVIKDKDFGSFDIRHSGYSFEQLQETLNTVVERLPDMVGRINQYNSISLTPVQQYDFAKKAIALRSTSDRVPTQEELQDFLTPRRPEDEGDSLWVLLNRVQESIMKGGYYLANSKGKLRKAKSIRNLKKDLELNQQVWELAMQYV